MSLHRCLEGDPFPARCASCLVSPGQGLPTEVVSVWPRALLIPGMLHAGKVSTILSSSPYKEWAKELPEFATFPISRPYYHVMKSVFSRELHGFTDASQFGYAYTVYISVVYTDGTISTALVYSKTNVAPLKSITIPKLELSGALLLARTLTHVAEQQELSVT